jgi:hypothetical protein
MGEVSEPTTITLNAFSKGPGLSLLHEALELTDVEYFSSGILVN